MEIIFQLVIEEQTPQVPKSRHVEEEVGVSVCLSVQFLEWYWVYFCIEKYRLKTDFVGYTQKSHHYHLYIHNFFDNALMHFLVDTFKFSFISFPNKMWYFCMWTIPTCQNT